MGSVPRGYSGEYGRSTRRGCGGPRLLMGLLFAGFALFSYFSQQSTNPVTGDTGRNDVDNITKQNMPLVTMTSEDPNVALAQALFSSNAFLYVD